MTYALDTNTIIHLLNNNASVISKRILGTSKVWFMKIGFEEGVNGKTKGMVVAP
jgi:predicted nucleic acid-binding protein